MKIWFRPIGEAGRCLCDDKPSVKPLHDGGRQFSTKDCDVELSLEECERIAAAIGWLPKIIWAGAGPQR